MILAFLIAALAAQPVPPAGTDAGTAWEVMTEDSAGQIMIDPASPRRDGDLVRVRVKVLDQRPGASFGFAIMRVVVDCPRRRHALEAGSAYTREGQLLGSTERPAGEAHDWTPFAQNASDAAYYRRVCGGGGAAR